MAPPVRGPRTPKSTRRGVLARTIFLPVTEFCRLAKKTRKLSKMINAQDLGFFANFLGVFILILVIAYHYVMADAKHEGN